MSVLRANRLFYRYPDGTDVLRGVEFSVGSGEMVSILGENASGKTTLLKILAGLLMPGEGSVTVDGVPILQARDRVGIVFQNPDHQLIAATVAEELALGMEFRGVPQAAMIPRVEELLQRFDLLTLRNTAPEHLSGGQKQRVALAAVMASGADFLLFDEPDSMLDAPSRADFMQSVEVVRKTCGIVWTSPHPNRRPFADQHYELREGLLVAL